jgi:hypothetical protein
MSKIQAAPSRMRPEVAAISVKQRQGRAANAVAELLMRKLLVPKIYIQPRGFPSERPIEGVIAVAGDRAGSGDIYAVDLILDRAEAIGSTKLLKKFLDLIPAHFRYLAVDSSSIDYVSKQRLFAEDGIGRIGVIEIIESPTSPPEARIVIPAERFRLDQRWIKKFDNFQKKTPADMEFRG